MFIGHYAVAFGAKKYAPQVSLGILFLACQLADLIWPNLLLMGIESVKIVPGITAMVPFDFVHYPWSHSLIALIIWAAVFGGIYVALTKAGTKAAIVIAILVLSHWVLDVLTHRPDMPVTFSDSSRIGLGLWNLPVVAVVSEVLLFGIGVWLYATHTTATNRRGTIGFWALVIFLLTAYVANIVGPLPPSEAAVAWSAQALWILVAWGFWIDRNREAGGAARDQNLVS